MKVLIISPAFPPISSVGVIRMSSLASYLVKNNDDVTVICDEANSNNTNGEGVGIPEGINILRIKSFATDRNRCKAYTEAIINECRTNKYDVAVISLGPYFTLRICSKVFKLVKVPYVLDFRDVGVFDDILVKNPIRKFIIALCRTKSFVYEFLSIRSSKYVVSVTDGWTELKKKNYPMFANKMLKIENGYDGERLSHTEFCRDNINKHSIAILGKLGYYSFSYATEFLDSLNELKSIYPDISFYHISDFEANVDKYIKSNGYNIDYNATGFVDYLKGMKILNSASVFVIIDRRKDAMGTKLYDYIYLNHPIIYVGPDETCIYRTVKTFKNGFCCKSKTECIEAIKTIFENNIEELDDRVEKNIYSRERQNEKYRALLINAQQ